MKRPTVFRHSEGWFCTYNLIICNNISHYSSMRQWFSR